MSSLPDPSSSFPPRPAGDVAPPVVGAAARLELAPPPVWSMVAGAAVGFGLIVAAAVGVLVVGLANARAGGGWTVVTVLAAGVGVTAAAGLVRRVRRITRHGDRAVVIDVDERWMSITDPTTWGPRPRRYAVGDVIHFDTIHFDRRLLGAGVTVLRFVLSTADEAGVAVRFRDAAHARQVVSTLRTALALDATGNRGLSTAGIG